MCMSHLIVCMSQLEGRKNPTRGCLSRINNEIKKKNTAVGERSGPNQIQHDLEELDKWANNWQMAFNSTKCKSLPLGNSNSKHQYSMDNTTLSQTTAEKDLGVNIDDSLKFHTHTSAVVSKANQIMAVIRKSFEHLDHTTVPLLYKTLIRPHLEYGNAIWGPHFILDQKHMLVC